MNQSSAAYRDYRIVRVLGEGGMGIVYEAEHGTLGRRVALKVLSERSNDDPTALARLRREALAMGSLQHPHIVQVSDFFEGPPPFLVMELLSGQSLRDRLKERGAMRPSDACLVTVQLLSALGAAHRAGIVHRDVKPANVLVVSTPVTDVFVKLLDFGVAKLMTSQGPALTHADAIVGSAPYMAPEQIRGEAIDGKTDLFAVGVTLYEMLAGRRPFVGGPKENVMVAILRGGPIAPLAGVLPELEAVVLRALSRSPTARFLTAEEMTAALMPFVPHADFSALATSAMSSRAPGSRTDVDQWITATSVTPQVGSEEMRSSTLAQTVDQTAAVGGGQANAYAPQLAPTPPAPNFTLPMAMPGGAMLASSMYTQPGASPSGRVGLFVALGVGALVVLLAMGRVALSVVGVPGASPALTHTGGPIYGSCTGQSKTTCTEFNAIGSVSQSREISSNVCTNNLGGTWSDGPCSHAGAKFGCRSLNSTGWFYAPFTLDQSRDMCPKSLGVVIAP